MLRNARITFSVAGVVAFILIWPGCGGGKADVAYVEGRVTMDGKPLEGATVLFVPSTGRPASGVTNSDGRYVLEYEPGKKGGPVGQCTVRITTGRGESIGPQGELIPGVPEKVPMRYNVQSELSVVVQAGKRNVFDFALESGGPIAVAEE